MACTLIRPESNLTPRGGIQKGRFGRTSDFRGWMCHVLWLGRCFLTRRDSGDPEFCLKRAIYTDLFRSWMSIGRATVGTRGFYDAKADWCTSKACGLLFIGTFGPIGCGCCWYCLSLAKPQSVVIRYAVSSAHEVLFLRWACLRKRPCRLQDRRPDRQPTLVLSTQ